MAGRKKRWCRAWLGLEGAGAWFWSLSGHITLAFLPPTLHDLNPSVPSPCWPSNQTYTTSASYALNPLPPLHEHSTQTLSSILPLIIPLAPLITAPFRQKHIWTAYNMPRHPGPITGSCHDRLIRIGHARKDFGEQSSQCHPHFPSLILSYRCRWSSH